MNKHKWMWTGIIIIAGIVILGKRIAKAVDRWTDLRF